MFMYTSANACTYAQQCADVSAKVFTETFLSAHLCCAACAYNRFLITLPSERRVANCGREGERSWLSHWCLEHQVAVETWRVCAVSIKQQLWRPTTERVLLADLDVELWSLSVTSGKLAGWSGHVYNMHPDFLFKRQVIMVHIMRIIRCGNCAYYNQIFMVSNLFLLNPC